MEFAFNASAILIRCVSKCAVFSISTCTFSSCTTVSSKSSHKEVFSICLENALFFFFFLFPLVTGGCRGSLTGPQACVTGALAIIFPATAISLQEPLITCFGEQFSVMCLQNFSTAGNPFATCWLLKECSFNALFSVGSCVCLL